MLNERFNTFVFRIAEEATRRCLFKIFTSIYENHALGDLIRDHHLVGDANHSHDLSRL